MNGADRGHELVGLDVLQHVADRAGVQRAEHVVVVIERGEDQDLDLRVRPVDPPRGLRAVHHRHADVHQDDVRPQAFRHANRLGAVLGDPRHRDLVLAVGSQDYLDAVGEQPLVIRDQNRDPIQ